MLTQQINSDNQCGNTYVDLDTVKKAIGKTSGIGVTITSIQGLYRFLIKRFIRHRFLKQHLNQVEFYSVVSTWILLQHIKEKVI